MTIAIHRRLTRDKSLCYTWSQTTHRAFSVWLCWLTCDGKQGWRAKPQNLKNFKHFNYWPSTHTLVSYSADVVGVCFIWRLSNHRCVSSGFSEIICTYVILCNAVHWVPHDPVAMVTGWLRLQSMEIVWDSFTTIRAVRMWCDDMLCTLHILVVLLVQWLWANK